MDPTYPLVPIVNFVSVVLVLSPLFCTSIRSGTWNIAVTSFTLWIAVECTTTGVNAILWSDNVRDIAPVWCDISTRLNYAARIALRACTFIMTRSLYKISMCGEINILDKRSNLHIISELVVTLGLPILTMILYYVVQVHRFEIIEEEGCVHAAAVSGLSILFLEIPNLILPVISAIFYCPFIFWSTYKQRKRICKNMPNNNSGISVGIYYRVMALGCVEALFTLPVSIYMFITDIQPLPNTFYRGWDAVHADFSTIPTYPAREWSKNIWFEINVRWEMWTNPVIAFAFFALFGLTEEARATYSRILWKVAGLGGMKEPPPRQDLTFSEMRFGTASHRDVITVGSPSTRVIGAFHSPPHSPLQATQNTNRRGRTFSLLLELEGGQDTGGDRHQVG